MKLRDLLLAAALVLHAACGLSRKEDERMARYEIELRRLDGSLDTISRVDGMPPDFRINTYKGSYWFSGGRNYRGVPGIIDYRVISSVQFWPPDSATAAYMRRLTDEKRLAEPDHHP